MKLISWNVNGLRACMKKGFADFFTAQNADIFALQETKMQEDQLDESMMFEGYHRYMNSAERKGYSGTMVYTRKEPLSVSYEIEGDITKEGRVITLEYEDFWFVCAYVPNSKDGLARLDYRMEWEEMLLAHLNRLNQSKPVVYCGDLKDEHTRCTPKRKPIILCGDLNVAAEDIDLKNPQANRKSPGFTDQERDKFRQLKASGFTDSFRFLHPDEIAYSWWSYRFNARARNAGWRIDYFMVDDTIKDRIKDARIHSDIFGSDHCPVSLEIDIQ